MTITVGKLLTERREFFELFPLLTNVGYDKPLTNSLMHRPGLALAGYTERFANNRTQVLGQTEVAFLMSLTDEQLEERLQKLFSYEIPLFIVTKGMVPPAKFLEYATKTQTAVFQTNLSTTELITRLTIYLDNIFAPQTTIHGSLVDVYGVGLLYTGKSGIGKSECTLDLVERGHRLVADDVVKITKKATGVIVGSAVEKLGHHMEVRGIGIIDIEKLFGIRSIRLQKRIEVEVRLEVWDTGIGIAEANRQEIFKEFVQIQDSERDSHRGLGLGLSLVKAVVEAHGGKATVSSQAAIPGFWIPMPLSIPLPTG